MDTYANGTPDPASEKDRRGADNAKMLPRHQKQPKDLVKTPGVVGETSGRTAPLLRHQRPGAAQTRSGKDRRRAATLPR
jgi:hypothetical protein